MPGDARRTGPELIYVRTGELDTSPAIAALIDDVRRRARAFVFLSGGASNVPDGSRDDLQGMMHALTRLADEGVRLGVGDGGTRTGVMEAAGRARAAARHPFPLVGIAPAGEITATGEAGRMPIDPNHSHVVAIEDAPGSRQGLWGSEIDAMFDLFARLSHGRPSVGVIANGGPVTLREVAKHAACGRKMIVIAGSGRAADALTSLLNGGAADDGETEQLRREARGSGIVDRADLFEIVHASAGPRALAAALARHLA